MPAKPFILTLLIGMLPLLGHRSGQAAAPLQVFAAASLTDALTEIGAAFAKQTGRQTRFNFAGSSILARQIEAGAPADIFFSADEIRMDQLQARGLIRRDTRVSLLSNQLVIAVNKQDPAPVSRPADLAGARIERIALADPQSVPAGLYARTYLEKQKLWSELEPKVIPTQNVRAALAALESGNVDSAIVYKTDAAISTKVVIAYEIPLKEGPAIRYPVAALQETSQPETARRFLDYLGSPDAAVIFLRHGFSMISGP